MVGEEKRSEMMLNLFGDQSEEEEIDSEHESNPQPNYPSVTLSLLFSFVSSRLFQLFLFVYFKPTVFINLHLGMFSGMSWVSHIILVSI